MFFWLPEIEQHWPLGREYFIRDEIISLLAQHNGKFAYWLIMWHPSTGNISYTDRREMETAGW